MTDQDKELSKDEMKDIKGGAQNVYCTSKLTEQDQKDMDDMDHMEMDKLGLPGSPNKK